MDVPVVSDVSEKVGERGLRWEAREVDVGEGETRQDPHPDTLSANSEDLLRPKQVRPALRPLNSRREGDGSRPDDWSPRRPVNDSGSGTHTRTTDQLTVYPHAQFQVMVPRPGVGPDDRTYKSGSL